MIGRDRRSRLTILAIAAVLVTTTGCATGDEAPAADSASINGTPGGDSVGQVLVPEPRPAVTDTVAMPVAPPGDLPPVAGETKKPIYEPRERDSVTEPKLEVGPDGKVRPIRR